MDGISKLIEQKIQEAIKNGELDNLPGKGKPIDLQADENVPEELRQAYRILKNAGVPPEEVLLKRNLSSLGETLLKDSSLSEEEKEKVRKEMRALDLQMNMKLERFKKTHNK